MGENKLIEEIRSLPKPNNFEQIVVDDIVGNYFKKGMPKEEVSLTLKKFGFNVSSQSKDKNDLDSLNYDESILVGVYEFNKKLFFMADYKVVIYFFFESNLTSEMKGFYIKNMF